MKLLVNAKDIFVEYNGKEVLNIEKLEIFDQQKIGLVGSNGSGKSTLLKVIMNLNSDYEGSVECFGDLEYISQLDFDDKLLPLSKQGSSFDVNMTSERRSGGEETRLKIANALSTLAHGIVADEPTSFLDQEGVETLISQFKYYYGALLIVSHDRYFLDEVVDTIWELKDGKIIEYKGNYSDYLEAKEKANLRLQREYEQFNQKKEALKKSAQEKRQMAQSIQSRSKKAKRKNDTKDGGRLAHQKDTGSKEKKLYQAAKSIEKELAKLEDYSFERKRDIKIRASKSLALHNAYPISGRNINKSYGDNVLFDDASFDIPLNSKVAIQGTNGSGKTSLFKMILNHEQGINIASKVKIGYFSQYSFSIKEDMSILEYMNKDRDEPESYLRSILHDIGFQANDISKSLSNLSGGEIMKLVLTRLMMDEYNVLILDEPTNFLDLESIEVIERLMMSYEGTIIFTCHDTKLVENVADLVYTIEDKKMILR